jgi:imidazolonepropionase
VLLVENAGEVVTSRGTRARSGEDLGRIDVMRDGAVAIRGEEILAVGRAHELRALHPRATRIDARGGTVVPGFVDAHTHPVFAGTREDEFEMRTRGATYVEIAQAGGGILSSVRGVRTASEDELLARLLVRLDRFLALGTTTIEAKSGYGLSLEDELKSLRVIARARAMHPVEIVPTFLGAHDIPLEFRGRKDKYVEILVEEMLPRVAQEELAEYCDVFVEAHTFTVDDARAILTRANGLGLRARLHADQLSASRGAELAAEMGAASADHLEFVDDAGIDALREGGVVAVLCPVVPLYLRIDKEAPGRKLIDRGVGVAISTDFNPGSCYLQSLPAAMAWAALRYRMSAAETICAATLNAAASLGRAGRIGTIEAGKQADLVCLDVPNHRHIVYEQGRNAVRWVMKKGRLVFDLSD